MQAVEWYMYIEKRETLSQEQPQQGKWLASIAFSKCFQVTSKGFFSLGERELKYVERGSFVASLSLNGGGSHQFRYYHKMSSITRSGLSTDQSSSQEQYTTKNTSDPSIQKGLPDPWY